MAIGGGVATLLILVFGVGIASLSSLVGFVYPAYKSFQAIETKTKGDDTQWLVYWVIFAIFSIMEVFVDLVLYWIPFYYAVSFVLYWTMYFRRGSTAGLLTTRHLLGFFLFLVQVGILVVGHGMFFDSCCRILRRASRFILHPLAVWSRSFLQHNAAAIGRDSHHKCVAFSFSFNSFPRQKVPNSSTTVS